mgnify:CR=1 FL=1
MKRHFRILCIILAALVVLGTVLTTSASAAAKYPPAANIPGYKGRIGMSGGAAVIERGDTLPLSISSSEIEDLSKLKIVWSVNPSEVKLTNKGYSKDTQQWNAAVTFLKGGITVPVYAIVNGTKLESDFKVWADPVHATKVALSTKTASLYGKDQTAVVNVTLYPAGMPLVNGDDHPAVITSNSNVVTGTFHRDPYPSTSDYILLLARGDGTATVTVKTRSGPSASCYVTVSGTGHKAKSGSASGKSSSNKGNTGAQQNYGRSGTPNSIIQEGHTVNPSASGNLNSGSSTSPTSSGKASGISSSSLSGVIPPKFSGTESDAPNTEQASEKKQAKHTNGWLIAVIVIIAASSVIIVYVLFKKKKAKQKLDETQEIKLKK